MASRWLSPHRLALRKMAPRDFLRWQVDGFPDCDSDDEADEPVTMRHIVANERARDRRCQTYHQSRVKHEQHGVYVAPTRSLCPTVLPEWLAAQPPEAKLRCVQCVRRVGEGLEGRRLQRAKPVTRDLVRLARMCRISSSPVPRFVVALDRSLA